MQVIGRHRRKISGLGFLPSSLDSGVSAPPAAGRHQQEGCNDGEARTQDQRGQCIEPGTGLGGCFRRFYAPPDIVLEPRGQRRRAPGGTEQRGKPGIVRIGIFWIHLAEDGGAFSAALNLNVIFARDNFRPNYGFALATTASQQGITGFAAQTAMAFGLAVITFRHISARLTSLRTLATVLI